MQQPVSDKESRKEVIKEVIRRLHSGATAEEMTRRFGQVLHGVSATEIAQIEQELIEEGMPREEVHRLCDVHLAVFRESLAAGETLAPPGHPIHTLMEEHRIMLAQAQELAELAQELKEVDYIGREAEERLEKAAEEMRSAESHYVREENVLFPYLEKHGITQPPAIMWMEHDQIREIKKGVLGVLGRHQEMPVADFAEQLAAAAVTLAETLASHFFKENNILYPASLRVITEEEWPEVRAEFDDLGYASFTPAMPPAEGRREALEVGAGPEGMVRFRTGTLSVEALEAVLDALPLDVTFVDKDDRVRYFNDIAERIFPRTRAVLGRTVQRCHPQKSLHVVNQILSDFRQGKRDSAEFWIEIGGRFIYIRYFPVRDRQGEYLGCLEVMQDVTRIRQLEGEKRLL
ncbi:MAG: DUF438 domain-containing protein [Anaerolineae bacterium]|nr:DUF438 domain-containing protein [Anaerolineae bacterium]